MNCKKCLQLADENFKDLVVIGFDSSMDKVRIGCPNCGWSEEFSLIGKESQANCPCCNYPDCGHHPIELKKRKKNATI